jgi:hypothetical protein
VKPTDNFWNSAGVALIIFAILFGTGSCMGLSTMNNCDHRQAPNPNLGGERE